MHMALENLKNTYIEMYGRNPTDEEIFKGAQLLKQQELHFKCSFLKSVIEELRTENAQLRRNR